MKRTLRIDDSLDVFPVHGVGGIIGSLLVAVFIASQYGGAGLAEDMTIADHFGVQLTAVMSVIIWTAVASYVILRVIEMICGLRVNDEIERNGLDISEHEEKGYNI
jgi:Amt family ammonium transporter